MNENILENLKGMEQHLIGLQEDLKARGVTPEVGLTTVPLLNSKIWGLRKGLTLVAARTSQGKSAFALQIALDTAKQHFPTLVLSLEMDEQSMIERLFCNEMLVNNRDLLSGAYSYDENIRTKFAKFCDLMEEMPLLITCGIGKTFNDCNHIIETLNPKPKVIILDYIQMAKVTQNDRIDISEYIRQFRQLMLQHGIRGVVCSQINRMIEKDNDYRPNLHNLKGSGALEECSDLVMLLHWSFFYTKKEHEKHIYDIVVAKNRHGATGSHKLKYLPEYYRFEELDPIEEREFIK